MAIVGKPGWFDPFNITFSINGEDQYKAVVNATKHSWITGFLLNSLDGSSLIKGELVPYTDARTTYQIRSLSAPFRTVHLYVGITKVTVYVDNWVDNIPFRKRSVKATLCDQNIKLRYGLRRFYFNASGGLLDAVSLPELAGILFFLSCQRRNQSGG